MADNVDHVNGYATTLPSNRIVVFAHPPIHTPEIRNYDDWSRLVVTHELAHIFHLDRADGIWRIGRRVFGRHPAMFPNAYMPAWVIEGLAVYYESRVTGSGRLEGSEHYMVTRAAAEARRVPRLGELSRYTSRFPGGEVVYAYGGQIFDYLSRTRGSASVPKFVDVTSRVLVPLSLNRKAKRAFGISFENAWRDWRDSLVRASSNVQQPMPGWRELTREGRNVAFPRWIGDTAILYTAATGKEVTSAYRVSLEGVVTRVGRRNGLDANEPTADGAIVFAQPDFTSPYHIRSDLYVQRDGIERRLTRRARLAHPDVRADGGIVAVQSLAGTTRLVRLPPDGSRIDPITTGTAEIQWGEPAWSPDGSLIAAVRVLRGDTSQVVVMDSTGAIRGAIVSERAIIASPSWSNDGHLLFYTSDRTGSSQVYVVTVREQIETRTGTRVSSASTGAFNPVLSPAGGTLAALSFAADGYHLGIAPLPARVERSVSEPVRRREHCRDCILRASVEPPSVIDLPAAKPYAAWRSIGPKYWEPIVAGSTETGTSVGVATSGQDVVGRHWWYAETLFNLKHNEADAFASYQYAGFAQPLVNLSVIQEWDHFRVADSVGTEVGDLARRARIAGLSISFSRPRVRTSGSFSIGADVESRSYSTSPDTLLGRLPVLFSKTRRYPSVSASAAWINARRPSLSISREDGIALSASVRQRWEASDFSAGSPSVIGVAAAYKSLDLPGFAHHVIAVRGAAGYAGRGALSTFSVGGVSGGSLDLLAGVTVGQERRTFGVRGFPPSAEQGIRAFAGTAEYRLPIAAPSRRVPFVPLLIDRISVSAFSEAGRAYCPAGARGVCEGRRSGPWMASAGGEIDLDTALQYDYPARFRAGVAVPFAGREAVGANRVSVYFTAGTSF